MTDVTHLFSVDGEGALPADSQPFTELGLYERDLQRWVLANPAVLGDDVMIVAAEHDRWVGEKGSKSRPRVDVLGLHSSGRLVVVELKRDAAGRQVHAQAITYAALASKFDIDSLAEAHRNFRAKNGEPALTADEARERLLGHVGGRLDPEQLLRPRILLIAGSYSDDVAHSARWLSENGIEVGLMQVQMWRIGDQLIAGFTQVYPMPERSASRGNRSSTLGRTSEVTQPPVILPPTVAGNPRGKHAPRQAGRRQTADSTEPPSACSASPLSPGWDGPKTRSGGPARAPGRDVPRAYLGASAAGASRDGSSTQRGPGLALSPSVRPRSGVQV